MRVSQSDVEITPSMNERNVPDTSIPLEDCNVTVNSVYSLIQMVWLKILTTFIVMSISLVGCDINLFIGQVPNRIKS